MNGKDEMDGYQSYGRHVNPVLAEFLALSGRDDRFVRAEGCSLITEDGDRYADWICGFGSANTGHNPDWLLECIRNHLSGNPPNLFPESLNPFSGQLAADLVRAAGRSFETCYFSNSGSEAVEAAIKTAIAATGRKSILSASGAYHGTTLGALSLMSDNMYRKPFEPLLPYHSIPVNNVAELQHALEKHSPAAFILEPVQMESGVRIPASDYLRQAASLCHDYGALMILDEVQTGMGRTGTLFAFQQTTTLPDILVLGKSLGGGLLPIGATLFREGLFRQAYGNYLSCEINNSTFGGNALSCRVAQEVLSRIANEDFLREVRNRAELLSQSIHSKLHNHPMVSRIKMCGLLGGITLHDVDHPWFSWKHLGLEAFEGRPITGPLLVHRMYRRRFLTQICAHDWSTLRIEPPLTVSETQCLEFVDALREELDWIHANNQ